MKQIETSKNRFYMQFAGYFLVFGITVALLTSLINYNVKYSDISDELSVKASAEADFKRQYLAGFLDRLELMLSSIVANDLTNDYIEDESAENTKKLKDLFYSLVYSNRDIMQLRFIDKNGMEKVRIDRNRTSPQLIIIPDGELQDKSSRYYFKDTSHIMGGTFWHSRIDLNVERGKIEVPFKPTFRVATPLILGNSFQGILIVNVLVHNLLDVLTNSVNFDIYLIDGDGEIIYSPNPDESWSRYLDNRKNINSLFPDYADTINTNDSYAGESFFMYPMGGLFNNSDKLRIIFMPKAEVVEALIKSNLMTAGLVAIIVLLVSVPLSWIASIIPSRIQMKLKDAYDEISRYNKVIDRNIPTSKTDAKGVITDVSTKFLMITGYRRDEVIGKTHNILRHPVTDDEHYRKMWNVLSTGAVWTGEMQDIRKDGTDFWIKQTITPELDSKGDIVSYTSIAEDITEKKLIEAMSVTDRLTGLYNRHKLDMTLLDEVNRFNRYRDDFCAVILDIDHFKMVNDNYGHQAGDDVLVKLADIIRGNTRMTDVCGRWGGEEFLIIAIQTDLEKAVMLAEKIRHTVESTEFAPVGNITVSIGVAQYEYGETIAHFINRADDALYEAKKSGRNRVIISEL